MNIGKKPYQQRNRGMSPSFTGTYATLAGAMTLRQLSRSLPGAPPGCYGPTRPRDPLSRPGPTGSWGLRSRDVGCGREAGRGRTVAMSRLRGPPCAPGGRACTWSLGSGGRAGRGQGMRVRAAGAGASPVPASAAAAGRPHRGAGEALSCPATRSRLPATRPRESGRAPHAAPHCPEAGAARPSRRPRVCSGACRCPSPRQESPPSHLR